MKAIIFALQATGVMLSVTGLGFLFGASHILGCFEKAGLGIDVSFWDLWGVLPVGALFLLFGYTAEFIYDAGCKSAAKEKED